MTETTKRTTKEHVPAPGRGSGMHGVALCGRWAHYLTGDHALTTRIALAGGDHWCDSCLRILRIGK